MPRKRGTRRRTGPRADAGSMLWVCDRSAPYVSISCDGGQHPHETWNLATFTRAPDGTWSEQVTGFTPESGEYLLPRGPRVFQWIDNDTWLPGPEHGMAREHLESENLRRRGKFECPHHCAAPVTIRWDRWVRELESRHSSGVSHLQLIPLATSLLRG